MKRIQANQTIAKETLKLAEELAQSDYAFLFPPLKPYRTGWLQVDETHNLYFEEAGNPKGKPVVFLHGGPGGGTWPEQLRFHDPQRYRIVTFAQRGCGKSQPFASLEDNTTWHLVNDISKLRRALGIERWQVFGGSWGSTLGLAYAQLFPDQVSEIIIQGIFLLRQKELNWLYQSGASYIYPDAWETYLRPIPKSKRSNLLQAYYEMITSSNAKDKVVAARAWALWHAKISYLQPDKEFIDWSASADTIPTLYALALIELYYFVNKGFFEDENQLIDEVDYIRHIPAIILQGRYDVIAPMEAAWELHKAWPEANFRIVENAGHSIYDPYNSRELVAATNHFVNEG